MYNFKAYEIILDCYRKLALFFIEVSEARTKFGMWLKLLSHPERGT